MNPLNTGLVLLACAMLVTFLGVLARIKRRQLAQFEHQEKAFYRHAGALIENPRTPEEVVRFLEFSSRALDRRWALLMFILFTPFVRRRSAEPKSRLSQEAQALPSAMKDSFYAAVDSLFGALCWQNLFLSWVFRWMTRPVSKPKDDHSNNKGAIELALVERVCARAA